jgi:hypothetical protein
LARGPDEVVAETVVSPKEVALESLSYTASEVVGRDGSSPEPKGARRPWPEAKRWCMARGPQVVFAETVVSPNEVALESLSYTASEVVGGEGWVEPRAQGCPKAVVCPKAEEVVWPTCNVPKKTVS